MRSRVTRPHRVDRARARDDGATARRRVRHERLHGRGRCVEVAHTRVCDTPVGPLFIYV